MWLERENHSGYDLYRYQCFWSFGVFKCIGKIMVYVFGFLVVAGLGYYVVSWLFPSWKSVRQLTDRRIALESSVATLQAEVNDYKRRQDRFATDPAFVERIARENGRSAPGEIVFVFE